MCVEFWLNRSGKPKRPPQVPKGEGVRVRLSLNRSLHTSSVLTKRARNKSSRVKRSRNMFGLHLCRNNSIFTPPPPPPPPPDAALRSGGGDNGKDGPAAEARETSLEVIPNVRVHELGLVSSTRYNSLGTVTHTCYGGMGWDSAHQIGHQQKRGRRSRSFRWSCGRCRRSHMRSFLRRRNGRSRRCRMRAVLSLELWLIWWYLARNGVFFCNKRHILV